jgi:MFS family permease
LGGIFLTILSGWLALYSWRFAFGVYLVSLIVLIMVWFSLPNPPATQQISTKPGRLPLGVFGMGFLTILLMVVFYLIPTRIALFLQNTGIGDAGQSGISIATMNLAAFLVGMTFGQIRKFLKTLTTLLALLSLGGGLLALNFVETFPGVLVSLFIAGMGIGTLMPTIFLITANMVSNEQNGPALSITNSSLYLGQFISPLIFSMLGTLFHFQQIREEFLVSGILTIIAAVIFLFWSLFQKRRSVAHSQQS